MTFFCCFDQKGAVIARCQTREEIEVLRHLQSKLEQFTKQLKKEGKLR